MRFHNLFKRLILIVLPALFVLGCSEKKYKAYDNYYLGARINDDSVFKAQTSRVKNTPEHFEKYYARIENMPNSTVALLSFKTIDETLTDISIRFGNPDYRSLDPVYQINGFKNYCDYTTKTFFLNSLRAKYGRETDSVLITAGKNSVTNLLTHSWDFGTHQIQLIYRIDDWLNSEDRKDFPENFNNYNQAEHNALWIEYSLQGEIRSKLEKSAKRKLSGAENKM